MSGAVRGCCCVRTPRSCFPCCFPTTGLWIVRIYGLLCRRLCKVTETASLSSVDLRCLYVSWETFTSQQIETIETSRSVLLPWAQLDVKPQHEGTQVSQMDEAVESLLSVATCQTLPADGELGWLLLVPGGEEHAASLSFPSSGGSGDVGHLQSQVTWWPAPCWMAHFSWDNSTHSNVFACVRLQQSQDSCLRPLQ